MVRMWKGSIAALVLIAATACASAGPPAPTFPDVGGVWEGGLVAQGQAIDGVLELTQTAGALQVLFVAEALGLQSEGEGEVTPDGLMRFTLRYNIECPGIAEFAGELNADGTSLTGTLAASDCTGDLEGTFAFSR